MNRYRLPIDNNEYHDLVLCPKCNKPEYWGCMICYNSSSYCRKCTYKRWQQESDWVPTESDFVFPKYEDGTNYAKKFANNYLIEGGED